MDGEIAVDDKKLEPNIDSLVEERVKAALAEIKGKLDAAYEKRDLAAKELETYKQKEREAEIALLKEQGNLKEAHAKEMEALQSRNAALEAQNLELTRDGAIKQALSALDTRNTRAYEMAQKEIAKEIIRDESGNWVHRSGKSISEFVAEFAADPENAFLFKPKQNNGGGGGQSNNVPDTATGKSLFAMSQADVIRLAKEGKLKRK